MDARYSGKNQHHCRSTTVRCGVWGPRVESKDVTTGKTPRKDAARNRRRILEAAELVFARRGLDGSVEEVAASAGVGVASVYRAFGSKAGLVKEVFEDVLDRAIAVLDECARRHRLGCALRGTAPHVRDASKGTRCLPGPV
ncbi:TetR/AcrR family transcriptional regulator [Streptomyces sp. NPDC007901]|uniref:TetR/AcrR family transcriptional regulator n=1 Tax=Streptomyces sp. NPDC007901 TaxID=3364785 RepID=UPI0036E4A143